MDAFDEIYQENVGVVFKFLMSLTMDPDVAEELTQETMFHAFRNRDSFDGRSKISVWLCQIAKHRYFSFLKKEKRKISADLQEEKASNRDVADELIKHQDAMSLHRIVQHLENPYKEVFYLRFFGSLSYGQISELLEKNESWARVTYYREKEKVKREFEQEQSP